MRPFLIVTALSCFALCPLAAGQGGGDRNPDLKTDPQALQRFLDLRVGLSIHWGPSSQTGDEISWSRASDDPKQRQIVPREQYDNLYKTFNPTKFDAEEWARLMNRWGMKYVMPTGKHHDGFALWFSRYSNYTMRQTPFGRDIMRKLGDAARRHGVVFGSYYSDLDWYHPDWPIYRGAPGPLFVRQTDSPNFPRYLEYMRHQLTELVQDYGVQIIEFDGEWDAWNHEVGSQMYRYLHQLSPTVMLSSRVDVGRPAAEKAHGEWDWHTYAGDYEERERLVDWDATKVRAESDWSDHPCQYWITVDKRQWAWNPQPVLLTPAELIHSVVTSVGAGCNVAVNLGPRPDGTFYPDEIALMDQLGAWLQRNSAAVYATRGGPFYPAPWGVSTRQGNRAYLHILKAPEGDLALPPLPQKVLSARLLGNGAKLRVRQTSEAIQVTVPAQGRDAIDTIVELEFDHPPEMQRK